MNQTPPNPNETSPPAPNQSQQAAPPPRPAVRVVSAVRDRRPWVTWGLMALTILIYVVQYASTNLLGHDLPVLFGAKVNNLIISGQYWRLITPTFLHGSILHIGFNMYALYVIGPDLEQYYGRMHYLALYLLSGFGGNVASFLLTPSSSLGASTAVFGLIAAQGIFVYLNRALFGKRSKALLTNIAMIVVINLALGLSPGIDNWGHLGGLLAGALFAWLSGPVLSMRQEPGELVVENKRAASSPWGHAFLVFAIFLLIALAKITFGS